MAAQVCPLLGAMDANNRRGPHIEFPSFENQCLANGAPEMILLGDQATCCLSGAYADCPRFRSSRRTPGAQAEGGGFVPFFGTAEEAWQQPAMSNIAFLNEPAAAERSRAPWGRLGAALIFLTVLLCGSTTAVYFGWDWITRDLRSPSAGRVDMAAAQSVAQAPAAPAVYVVMTATPLAMAAAQSAAQSAAPAAPLSSGAAGSNNLIPVLPAAVTPTPIRVQIGAPAVLTPEQNAAPGGDPPIDVGLLVPTRRPTPEFDLPTSTPLAVETSTVAPTDTPTETPTPLGTPIVIFAPVSKELEKGECTLVRWNVQNVREVYYENLPMNGQGEREECINDENETYTLLVVLSNGQAQTYTTTVSYLPPTPTPTPTPSFTPEPQYTPTWTPEPPIPTAPPNLFYAVNLAPNGPGEITCAAGQTCEVGLLATNGGSGMDNVSVLLLAATGVSVQLCRPDGVCGGDSVPINNMGAGNTAYVVARVSVPADAAAQSRGTATFQARSDGSGGGVTSSQINVSVTVP